MKKMNGIDFSYSSVNYFFLLLNFQTGKLLQENDKDIGHKKTITSLAKSTDGSHFLTGSLDKSAKVINSITRFHFS